MTDTIVGTLAIAGALLVVLAGVGVLRLGDLYSRMHAATKATALGIMLIAAATAITLDTGRAKVVLAAVFIAVTAPAAAHFIGRAAYRTEGVELRLDGPDDLRDLVDGSEDAPT